MRTTRHALAKTVCQLDYARAELDKQRRDAGYQFTRCKVSGLAAINPPMDVVVAGLKDARGAQKLGESMPTRQA
ncbi:hypothetical protein E4U33_002615 [Claviceps sp. LM78 group G4]|nr:hypothetical protein E4U33_002615 [Claviceps sp. LM78 group G4]